MASVDLGYGILDHNGGISVPRADKDWLALDASHWRFDYDDLWIARQLVFVSLGMATTLLLHCVRPGLSGDRRRNLVCS